MAISLGIYPIFRQTHIVFLNVINCPCFENPAGEAPSGRGPTRSNGLTPREGGHKRRHTKHGKIAGKSYEKKVVLYGLWGFVNRISMKTSPSMRLLAEKIIFKCWKSS